MIAGMFDSLDEVFNAWKTIPEMAIDVGESHWTVTKWRRRKSIPVTAWPVVIQALKRKGKNVGAADLLAMHTVSKLSPISKPDDGGTSA